MSSHALYKRGLAPLHNLTWLTTTASHSGPGFPMPPRMPQLAQPLPLALSMTPHAP